MYLTRRGNTDSSWPVIVEMSHFVRQSLDLVNLEVALIMDHDVVSWRHCTLSNML